MSVVGTGGLVGLQGVHGGGEGAAQVLVTAGKVGQDLKETVSRLREAPGGPVQVRPAAGAGVGPGPAGGAQGVAVSAARHRALGDHRQADRALQQRQHAQGQLLQTISA